MLRRIVVPVLLALLVLGDISASLAQASSIRADQRHAAAVAKERRAVAAYQKAVLPLTVRVFDAVQPLQDVDDAVGGSAPGVLTARDDVLARSGAAGTLATVTVKLKAVQVPASKRAAGKALVNALASLSTASKELATATKAPGDRTGYVAAFGSAYQLLSSAETDWLLALKDVYGEALKAPVPSVARSAAQGRKVPTHGGFIQSADLACAKTAEQLDAVGDMASATGFLRNAPKFTKAFRQGNAALVAIPIPPADTAFVHRLRVQVQAANAFGTAIDSLVTAAKRHDLPAVNRAEAKMRSSLTSLRDLSRAFTKYGVTGCSEYYNVDDLLAPKGKGSGPLAT